MFQHVITHCYNSTGNRAVWIQPPDNPFPWRWMSVQGAVHIFPWNRGDRQAQRHGTSSYQPQNDRQTLQIQLRPQAVHRHPCQVRVGQRRRSHHPRPPVAGQAAEHVKEKMIPLPIGSSDPTAAFWLATGLYSSLLNCRFANEQAS